ncbi:MAG: TetR/AcrR family transcriptional regulator [Herminiimonas sp.]|nr:TetR/AcrR family transcriptional regulator [Herminiimonas sp.]
MIDTLPVNFTLAEFRKVTPINELNIWDCLLERNGERISVKRRDTARDNLQRILISTFGLANTVGFRAMTLRDLCRETGMSMGGLYGYIQNKDQLAAMIEDMVRYVSGMLPDWFRHLPSPLDQVECMVRAHIYFAEILQPWLFFVFLESRTLAPAQRKVAKASELTTHEHIATLLESTGNLTAAEAFLLAAHCMALAQDWHVKRWKFRSTPVCVDEFADSVVQLIRARVTMVSGRARSAGATDLATA